MTVGLIRPELKALQSQEIALHTAEFLRRGGVIRVVTAQDNAALADEIARRDRQDQTGPERLAAAQNELRKKYVIRQEHRAGEKMY